MTCRYGHPAPLILRLPLHSRRNDVTRQKTHNTANYAIYILAQGAPAPSLCAASRRPWHESMRRWFCPQIVFSVFFSSGMSQSASVSAHGSTRRRARQALRAASGGDGDGDFRAVFGYFRKMLRRYAVTSNPAPPHTSGDFRLAVFTSQLCVALSLVLGPENIRTIQEVALCIESEGSTFVGLGMHPFSIPD